MGKCPISILYLGTCFLLNGYYLRISGYVKSEEYAPSTIQNVVIGRQAHSIVLTEAASGNGFYCPYEFTTQQISYTHSYGMTTGVGEARGWETIALPFDVQKISHSEKGEIVPFALWQRGEAKKPFWLMRLGENGFVEANGIRANLPYIISMPNHTDYLSDYILAGSVTFSAENVTVRKTDEAEPQQYGDRTFWPNFAVMDIGAGCLALNVKNNLETNKSGMTEGSRFVLNSRAVHPFEAYMTTSASARSIGIFDDMTTAIDDRPICKVLLDKDASVFDLQGRKIAIPTNGQVKKGVYIKKGKKYVIR